MKLKLNDLTVDLMFKKLVVNAIDYLQTSIKELETRPKYSLINFVTAVELFLKAPLLKEHWTLLIDKLDEDSQVNIDNLLEGRLKTINFKQTIERLDKVLGYKLSPKEKTCFSNLRNHRNKLLHFYSKEYSGKSPEFISQVVIEQCEAWHYLNNLLLEKWSDIFSKYRPKIASLAIGIKKNKKFLAGKYKALSEELKSKEKGGEKILKCNVCDYKSLLLSEHGDMWHIGECLVCDHIQNFLVITCPNEECGRSIILNDGYSKCNYCNTEIDSERLLSLFEEPSEEIYCSFCNKVPASVVTIEGEYFCLSCFENFIETSECEYCYTKYAGDVGEDTGAFGCGLCAGAIGERGDKD